MLCPDYKCVAVAYKVLVPDWPVLESYIGLFYLLYRLAQNEEEQSDTSGSVQN